MKRETNIKEMPFYKNLVFFAPLTEGDLKDHISGIGLVANNGATYGWDEDMGAYLFELTTSTAGETGIEFPELVVELDTDVENVEFTCIADVFVKNSTSRLQFPMLSTKNYRWKYDFYGLYDDGNRWIRLYSVKYKGGTKFEVYMDYMKIEESTLGEYPDYNQTHLVMRPNWLNNNINIFIKNAYIYNRALSEEEIRQL